MKLIISLDSYTWLRHTSGMIMTEGGRFDVMIIFKDDKTPIYKYERLCDNAIYEQRKHDLFKISKEIGITKLMNLGYTNNSKFDVKKFTSQILPYIMLSNIKEVYSQDSNIFNQVLGEIVKDLEVDFYIYGKKGKDKVVILDQHIYKKKLKLRHGVIGARNKRDKDFYIPIERFNKK